MDGEVNNYLDLAVKRESLEPIYRPCFLAQSLLHVGGCSEWEDNEGAARVDGDE